MIAEYRRNHYVPQWYQRRFFPADITEKKFHYLDLRPQSVTNDDGVTYVRNAVRRLGTASCFCQDDLYTTRFGDWYSTDIEKFFFGQIDDATVVGFCLYLVEKDLQKYKKWKTQGEKKSPQIEWVGGEEGDFLPFSFGRFLADPQKKGAFLGDPNLSYQIYETPVKEKKEVVEKIWKRWKR